MIKKIIYILIVFIIAQGTTFAFPSEEPQVNNIYGYKFKASDKVKFEKYASLNMRLSEAAKTPADRRFYLHEAMRYYYLLLQTNKKSIKAHIGLGRIYDEMDLDTQAKEHFYDAYNMDVNNPTLNIYFGDFYYKRDSLNEALKYYRTAYSHGCSNNYSLNLRMGTIYEKVGDLNTAKYYYIKALRLNPNNAELKNKIHLLDELNYSETQYYLFVR